RRRGVLVAGGREQTEQCDGRARNTHDRRIHARPLLINVPDQAGRTLNSCRPPASKRTAAATVVGAAATLDGGTETRRLHPLGASGAIAAGLGAGSPARADEPDHWEYHTYQADRHDAQHELLDAEHDAYHADSAYRHEMAHAAGVGEDPTLHW